MPQLAAILGVTETVLKNKCTTAGLSLISRRDIIVPKLLLVSQRAAHFFAKKRAQRVRVCVRVLGVCVRVADP